MHKVDNFGTIEHDFMGQNVEFNPYLSQFGFFSCPLCLLLFNFAGRFVAINHC